MAISTEKTCLYCIAVNHCWFVNTQEKMPKAIMNQKINLEFLANLILSPNQLHLNCNCKLQFIETPNWENIETIFDYGKFDYTFKEKLSWLHKMGYTENDYKEFVDLILNQSKIGYANGEYIIKSLDKYGQRVGIKIQICGKSLSQNKIFNI